MNDNWLKFLIAAGIITYITNTWLTIIWKTYGNGRDK